jgi:hypothetical protein
MNADYMIGTDVIGAAAPSASDGPYIVIHVNNVSELVASQGGSIGTLASALLPATINKKVYDTMAQQIQAGFVQNGVKADVNVVAGNPPSGDVDTDLFPGMVIGAGIVGVAIGLVKAFKHFKARK